MTTPPIIINNNGNGPVIIKMSNHDTSASLQNISTVAADIIKSLDGCPLFHKYSDVKLRGVDAWLAAKPAPQRDSEKPTSSSISTRKQLAEELLADGVKPNASGDEIEKKIKEFATNNEGKIWSLKNLYMFLNDEIKCDVQDYFLTGKGGGYAREYIQKMSINCNIITGKSQDLKEKPFDTLFKMSECNIKPYLKRVKNGQYIKMTETEKGDLNIKINETKTTQTLTIEVKGVNGDVWEKTKATIRKI